MINLQQILGPLLMSAVLKGEDIGPIIDALIDAQINQTILDQVLSTVQVPPEWKPLVDTLKLVSQFDSLKCALAVMRGEQCTPALTIDKIISLVMAVQLISALSGGGGGGGGAASQS